jgi:hypothetical protein
MRLTIRTLISGVKNNFRYFVIITITYVVISALYVKRDQTMLPFFQAKSDSSLIREADLASQKLRSFKKVTFEQEGHVGVAVLNVLQNKLFKSV